MKEPWNLAESNYATIRDQSFEVAVLPFGATEPHNLHLPYSTDTLEATIIGQQVCRAAWERGARVVLLPTIPYGTETNLSEFPLAMNLNPGTLTRIVEDLLGSIVDSGIRKVLLLNSHGGNTLKPVLRELKPKTPAKLFLCDWYHSISDVYDDLFDEQEDHAGEMETSLGLAWFPELVAVDEAGNLLADAGEKKRSRFEAIEKGWVSITRPWHLLTTNSGASNPHKATAEKGRQLMEILVNRLSSFLLELSESEIDERFPY